MQPDYRAYFARVTDSKEKIFNGLDFIEWEKQFTQDSTVFIKPNFTHPYYKEGITTNPEVLRCLHELLQDRVARVIVGDSNGGNHSFTADQAFKGHGMLDICKETGAELVNLSTLPSRYIEDIVQGRRVNIQVGGKS